MELFPLHLFPEGSLASSVVTTVWVGVLVVSIFNLRLGWVYSGLVVPGYLVPLLLVKPWSAFIILIEGLVTHILARFFSERLSSPSRWCSLFGRDRFFALILISVAVRILFDSWLLPWIGDTLNQRFNIPFDHRSDLHSFGLIIICLLANQFWKTGILRGILPMLATLGGTYVVVRFGLMAFTNFSISSLGYLYEDVATSILASPKAYIILITTAFVASRMNLKYGWDFNGILIPSLIALQWYQPAKILTSFCEALLILMVATLVLRLPIFKTLTMEGARKLLLFFNISFLYKVILAYLIARIAPAEKVTDFFGFGYLLPTLIALKMHQRGAVLLQIRATIQVSIAALLVGSGVGYALTFTPNWSRPGSKELEMASERHAPLMEHDVARTVQAEKVRLYMTLQRNSVRLPLPRDMTHFRQALNLLADYQRHPSDSALVRLADVLNLVGYEVVSFPTGYIYLREQGSARGWGSYLVRVGQGSELALEVPAPLDEPGTLEAGLSLMLATKAKTLALAGSLRDANLDGSADVLRYPASFYHEFHKNMARRNVLQVRGYPRDTAEPTTLGNILWVKNSLPPDLNLTYLRDICGELEIRWGSERRRNLQRDSSRREFAQLVLDPDSLRQIIFRPWVAKDTRDETSGRVKVVGSLRSWLLEQKTTILRRGADRYPVASLEDLLFFDEEVVAPIQAILQRERQNGTWTRVGAERLEVVARAAQTMGYSLLEFADAKGKDEALVLCEQGDVSTRRHWGIYVFRISEATPYIIQTPRPLLERRTWEYAIELFANSRAKALLLATAHPFANSDGSADLVRFTSPTHLFNLVHQVLLRESPEHPMMVVQCRALKEIQRLDKRRLDGLVALHSGTVDTDAASDLAKGLLRHLQESQGMWRLVDGSIETAGYEASTIPQTAYLQAAPKHELAVLWIAPSIRSGYRSRAEESVEALHAKALGILTGMYDVQDRLSKRLEGKTPMSCPIEWREKMERYRETRDIIALSSLANQPEHHEVEYVVDLHSRQAFLVVSSVVGNQLIAVNLESWQPDKTFTWVGDKDVTSLIDRFMRSRAGWLETGAAP